MSKSKKQQPVGEVRTHLHKYVARFICERSKGVVSFTFEKKPSPQKVYARLRALREKGLYPQELKLEGIHEIPGAIQ